MSKSMRAKLVVESVRKSGPDESLFTNITFRAVSANAYPDDGSDENNTFAKFTPAADLRMSITNPALVDAFEIGDEFVVDFTPTQETRVRGLK